MIALTSKPQITNLRQRGTDNHPIELWSNKVIGQKLDYLHNNPVEERFVFKAEQYVYSSAIDYAGEKGLLDIIII